MLPLLAMGADECVDALVAGGFSVVRRTSHGVLLERGSRQVHVPMTSLLTPDQLLTILESAGLSNYQFLELFSDMPTAPGVLVQDSGVVLGGARDVRDARIDEEDDEEMTADPPTLRTALLQRA
jgi:hypothetical protein